MNRIRFLPLLLLLLACFSLQSQGQDKNRIVIPVEDFATNNPDSVQWEPLEVKADNLTEYRLITEGDSVSVIRATSSNAASGLIYQVDIDPKKYPIIQWRWKVSDVIDKGNVYSRDGDDYPARIYLTFEYDRSKLGFRDKIKYWAIKTFTSYEIPLRSINYIWANGVEKGTIVPNPYTNWVQMFVCRTGREQTGEWITETKNIYDHYQQAFGELPGRITGVAIMTDTDNTGESVTGYYDDIIFKKAE
ncbi:MAG: DUF3047 domain-containing protein [Balneolaceae bacterium]|nr:DUF3047 domain-containing protein [Balneolaceae bacterium]